MIYQLLSYALATFLTLLPITNPVGAVPIFYSLTPNNSPKKRSRQARQVAINVVVVLTIFFVAGRLILDFFGISLGVLQIAGGLIAAHTAWEMVTFRQRLTTSETEEATFGEDISFIPMAIPIVSGPGAIGIVIGLAAKNPQLTNYFGSFMGIGLLGIILYFSLVLGEPIIRTLGKKGVGAFNRVLGFFILAIAIQLIADGINTILPIG